MHEGAIPADVEASNHREANREKAVELLPKFVPVGDIFAVQLRKVLCREVVYHSEGDEVDEGSYLRLEVVQGTKRFRTLFFFERVPQVRDVLSDFSL